MLFGIFREKPILDRILITEGATGTFPDAATDLLLLSRATETLFAAPSVIPLLIHRELARG
jgi:hypothetical protein